MPVVFMAAATSFLPNLQISRRTTLDEQHIVSLAFNTCFTHEDSSYICIHKNRALHHHSVSEGLKKDMGTTQ